MEGHGRHWMCIGEPDDIFATFPTAVEHGTIHSLGTAQWNNDPAGPPHRDVAALSYPDDGLGYTLLLAMADGGQGENSFWSAFPFIRGGVAQTLELRDIEEWQNTVEARLRVTVDGQAEVGLFDTMYLANRARYAVGEAYDFCLAGLAYHVEVLDEVEPDLAGARILLPITEGSISDFHFQTVVEDLRRTELAGLGVSVMRVSLFVIDDQDFYIDLYATDRVIDGKPLQVGDTIAGQLWLQGYLADTEFRIAEA